LKRKETEGRRQRAHLLEGGREGAPARCACEADCSIKRTRSVLSKTIIAFVARSRALGREPRPSADSRELLCACLFRFTSCLRGMNTAFFYKM
jgi:hypothetical protein